MKVTLSVLKADIGSVGARTRSSRGVLAKVDAGVREEVDRPLVYAAVIQSVDGGILRQR